MPHCNTCYFGKLSYSPDTIIEFSQGLPGFEHERRFIVIEQPQTKPLVYVQSLETPTLCFIALPAQLVDASYRLELSDEDAQQIGFPHAAAAVPGSNVLCLVLLSLREAEVTANLMAPVVISLATRKAVQAISTSGRYSHQHPVEAAEAVPA
jgi:flagellar assembly factor FliW